MPNPQQWIKDLNSEDPKTRIPARINLLSNFPERSSEDLKKSLSLDLYRDVRANPDTTVDYVLSIPDLQKKAYAIAEVNSGLSDVPREVGARAYPICRKRFLHDLEALAIDLDKIEEPETRLEVGMIIASECPARPALQALDKIWAIGYKTWIDNSDFASSENYVAYRLGRLAANETREREVRTRALNYVIRIPERDFFKEPLKQVITSSDDKLAIKAGKAYILKLARGAEEELKPEKIRNSAESVLLVKDANPAVVSYAFDILIENTPAEEKARSLVYYQSEDFHAKLGRVSGREFYSKGLAERVMHHLKEQVDNIGRAESLGSREEALFILARRGDKQIALKAVDYLAKTSPRINGVHNIAQLYLYGNKFPLSESVKSHVLNWVLDYIRDFKSLENKNLASGVLLHLGGWYDSSRPEDEVYGEGALFTEKSTGRKYNEIAKEELDELIKARPTREDELKAAFGVTQ